MSRLVVMAGLALLAVAEVAVVMALYDWLGGLRTAVVLGADMLIGLIVMRRAATGSPTDRGWRILGGAFIALPGLVLDLVGVALLVPASRAMLKRALRRNAESALRRSGMSVVTVTDGDGVQRTTVVPGDVIQGEVVPTPDPPTPHRPPSDPQIIRGEIVQGEEGTAGS